MIFRLLFLGFFSVLSIHLLAQERLSLQVLDATSNVPIDGVYVSVKGSFGASTVTSKEGKADLKIRTNRETCLQFSHLQYRDTTICFTPGSLSDLVVIKLNREAYSIGEVIVETGPDTVYGHHQYHVADYAFLPEGMLLLTYESERYMKRQEERGKSIYDGCQLVLLDEFRNMKAALTVGEQCVSFHCRYPGKAILRTRHGYHWVIIGEEDIYLAELENDEFNKFIAPVQDSLKGMFIASNWTPNYPAFDYYHFEENDSVANLLLSIEDEFLMEMFRAEYKWLPTRAKLEAYRAELKTGVDKEVIAGHWSGFAQSMYYEPLYAPVFAGREQIYVFDHYDDQLYFIDANAEVTDSLRISYHKGKAGRNWDEQLIFDPATDRCYVVFEKNGVTTLNELDMTSGELLDGKELTHRRPDHLSIRDGQVYYIYRPFESSQTRYIYREGLF